MAAAPRIQVSRMPGRFSVSPHYLKSPACHLLTLIMIAILVKWNTAGWEGWSQGRCVTCGVNTSSAPAAQAPPSPPSLRLHRPRCNTLTGVYQRYTPTLKRLERRRKQIFHLWKRTTKLGVSTRWMAGRHVLMYWYCTLVL